MSVQSLTRALSTQDAVDAVWESVLDGTYKGPSEAARALWSSMTLAPSEKDFLALEGLIAVAMQAKAEATRSGTKIPWGAPHGKAFEKYIALTWPFERADGSQAPLLKFSRSDLSAFALRAAKLSKSWDERREWAIATDELLVKHGVATVERLPEGALAEVAAEAKNVFGKQA